MKNRSTSIHEIRIGLIKVSILRKKSKHTQTYSFKLERLFRDGEHWRKSTRLDQGDLLIASKALELAYDWVELQSRSGDSND
jgi:hypothetical protein